MTVGQITLRPCEMCGAPTVSPLHEKPRVVCLRCRQQPPTDTEDELRKAVFAIENALRVANGHSTTLPPPMLPAVSRIPPEALAAVERVLAHRAVVVAEVPGQEVWRTKTPHHQAMKCVSHVKEYHAGERADRDTGESPLAHAAARALLGLALALRGER